MESPLDALVADMVNELDADRREEFEERAGIMEFDGKMPRAHAECLAFLNVLRCQIRSPVPCLCQYPLAVVC